MCLLESQYCFSLISTTFIFLFWGHTVFLLCNTLHTLYLNKKNCNFVFYVNQFKSNKKIKLPKLQRDEASYAKYNYPLLFLY